MKILDDALLDKINGGLSKEWQEELDEKIRTYKRINYTKERLIELIRTDFAYVPCEDESLRIRSSPTLKKTGIRTR